MDGTMLLTQSDNRVFIFRVPITGEHVIRAVAGTHEDVVTIRKANAPDPTYQFAQNGGIVNWFDKENFKSDCFSMHTVRNSCMTAGTGL